jgi:hypothetical protein
MSLATASNAARVTQRSLLVAVLDMQVSQKSRRAQCWLAVVASCSTSDRGWTAHARRLQRRLCELGDRGSNDLAGLTNMHENRS